MNIKVTKLTDVDLLRKCASFTSGKDCNMSLLTAYKNRHSIIRSQLFVIEMTDIPLFCASQFVRSTQGVNWYQKSKRVDRGGHDFADVCDFMARNVRTIDSTPEDDLKWLSDQIQTLPEQFDRMAPTGLCGIMNAEAIMNMSAKRLCAKASKETREIWDMVINELMFVDPDLVPFCVKPCVASGVCKERSCGFMATEQYRKQREMYKLLFKQKV